jgi:hypothetical protein
MIPCISTNTAGMSIGPKSAQKLPILIPNAHLYLCQSELYAKYVRKNCIRRLCALDDGA